MAHPTVPTAAPSFALALLAFFVTNNTQANTVLEQANKAHLEARTWPQPQWPKTQVAQRAFCGNEIFAERRNGKNYAWVLPNIRDKKKQGNVEIMEFFSNKRVRGRIFEYPEGWYNLQHKFLEKNGTWHHRNIELEYDGNRSYAATEWVNKGVGNGKKITFFRDDIPLYSLEKDVCSPVLHATSIDNIEDGGTVFSKVLMHRLPPYKRCPKARVGWGENPNMNATKKTDCRQTQSVFLWVNANAYFANGGMLGCAFGLPPTHISGVRGENVGVCLALAPICLFFNLFAHGPWAGILQMHPHGGRGPYLLRPNGEAIGLAEYTGGWMNMANRRRLARGRV